MLDVTVDVLDINDNLPEFGTDQPLVWRVAPEKRRKYSIVGKAVANDADGDDIIYSFSDQVHIKADYNSSILTINIC